MSVSISNSSVRGASGAAASGEDLTAWAHVTNDGGEPVSLEVDFRLDHQSHGPVAGRLDAGQADWFQAPVGQLAEGGHELQVVVGIDDGQSSSSADAGFSFVVHAGTTAAPTVDVGEVVIQPHSNVQHDPGEAWVGERLRLSVLLHNTGGHPTPVTVSFDTGAGPAGTESVEVGASEQRWVTTDVEPLEAGRHTITAMATTETSNASVLLGTRTAALTVSAPNAGWRAVNVQVTLHDFRNRPLSGRAVFLTFAGMDGDTAGGAETVEGTATAGGVLTRPATMIPPRGTMRVMAVSTGDADEPLEALARYRLAEGQTDLGFTANQRSQTRTIRARSMRAVRDQLTGEVNAGIDIEVVSIGGSLASEAETTREFETEVEWEVRYGQASLEITADTN